MPLLPRQRTAYLFSRFALAVVFIWIGAMSITGVSAPIFERWISGHALLASLFENNHNIVRYIIGSFELISGLLIALPKLSKKSEALGYNLIAVYCIGALSLMFTNPVWIDALGGFPAIGAGQGIIKYISILGVALWIKQYISTPWQRGSKDSAGFLFIFMGLVVVLLWIGAMKFTLVEAQGIEPLITSSFLFSWMANFLSIQHVSYGIGLIELMTVVALFGWFYSKRIFHIGIMLCLITFISTLSFMISFAGTWLNGFPYLSSSGHFLLKDMVLLAGTIILLAEDKQRR
ncbi:DUF417 family protein [Kordiimonas sp. SCSIO 12610]|nr:DUF417 family protein [Kordiimonas sp. SCSIO 12610]